MLHLQYQVGYDKLIQKIPISQGVAGRVIRTQKPELVEDAASDPDFLYAFAGLNSEICVPLINDGQAIGTMIVEARDSKKLTQNDLRMLITLSEQLSVAVERARLYTAVQESSQKYQRVVNTVREIIFQTDLHGSIIFLNKAWEHITGYTIDDSMGKQFAAFIPPEYVDDIQTTSLKLIHGEQQQIRFKSELVHLDSNRVPVEVHLQCIYDVEGQLIGVGGTMTDITRRVEAEKREQERGLLVQVRAAISSQLDLKETIRTIVEATASAFQYDLVGVYLLRGNTLYLQHQVGYEITFDSIDISVGVSGRVARTGIPALVEDTSSDPDFVHAMSCPTSEVCVPLLNKGLVIGIMNVESKGKRLTESDLNMMIDLSEHVSIVVERSQLYMAVVESNQRYQMVVDNIHEVIFQLNPEGIFTFLNESWVELSGYSIEESLGKHYSTFMPPEDIAKAEALGNLLYEGKEDAVRYQHSLIRSDGSTVPLEVRIQLIYSPNEESVGIGGTAINISERIQAEQQSLNLLLQTRTVEMLRSFLTGVSHDLRTPLSIMNTSLYLLRRNLGAAANGNRYLGALDKQTDHMQHVIEDMLDMSKLDEETTELSLMRVDINGLIRDLLVTLNTNAEAKHQRIIYSTLTDHSIIMSDQSMIGKAIKNVLKNAIQYTPEGGQINIVTSNGSSDLFRIDVSDSGIGIDATILPHIFDRFYKADAARPTGQGGMGLGLSIARKIIEMHGGTITAASTPGKGSTFTIALPIR